jgi:hypothetical protein
MFSIFTLEGLHLFTTKNVAAYVRYMSQSSPLDTW